MPIICDAPVYSGGCSAQDRSAAQLYGRGFESPGRSEWILGNRFWERATIDPVGGNRVGVSGDSALRCKWRLNQARRS